VSNSQAFNVEITAPKHADNSIEHTRLVFKPGD